MSAPVVRIRHGPVIFPGGQPKEPEIIFDSAECRENTSGLHRYQHLYDSRITLWGVYSSTIIA